MNRSCVVTCGEEHGCQRPRKRKRGAPRSVIGTVFMHENDATRANLDDHFLRTRAINRVAKRIHRASARNTVKNRCVKPLGDLINVTGDASPRPRSAAARREGASHQPQGSFRDALWDSSRDGCFSPLHRQTLLLVLLVWLPARRQSSPLRCRVQIPLWLPPVAVDVGDRME